MPGLWDSPPHPRFIGAKRRAAQGGVPFFLSIGGYRSAHIATTSLEFSAAFSVKAFAFASHTSRKCRSFISKRTRPRILLDRQNGLSDEGQKWSAAGRRAREAATARGEAGDYVVTLEDLPAAA